MTIQRTPREWRALAGLSQAELAERGGMDRSTVAAIEAGDPGTVLSAGKYAKAINSALCDMNPRPHLTAADIVAACQREKEVRR